MTTRSLYIAVLVPVLLLAIDGRGQDPATAGRDEVIAKLIAKIEQLEQRVAELEGSRAASEIPNAESHPAAHGNMPAGLSVTNAAAEMPTYPSLSMNGFADVNFIGSDDPGSSQGFSDGQFVLHFSSALSPKWTFAAETALTARPSGFRPSVERAIIKYSHSDAMKLGFGRFHTPVNWWNTEFHHGLWLQTTISRPEMTQFGGEYIPVHFVGAVAEGAIPSGGLNLNYGVGIGNGRSSNLIGAGDAGDSNSNRAWVLNGSARPERWRNLRVGGAYYQDKVVDRSGVAYREFISSAHLVWAGESPEIIAEFANVRHRPSSGGEAFDSPAFYIQAAYRLGWRDGKLKPYYRYEYIDIDARDTVFRNAAGLKGSTLGFRYDLSLLVALKAEFRLFKRPREERTKAGVLQLSFTF